MGLSCDDKIESAGPISGLGGRPAARRRAARVSTGTGSGTCFGSGGKASTSGGDDDEDIAYFISPTSAANKLSDL